MKIDEEFQFGKYTGKTPREVLHEKKGLYLVWCLENIKNFRLEPAEFEQAVRERYGKQYIAIIKI